MPNFQFSLVSPEKLLFGGQVEQVDVPGLEGDFGVLSGHAPIVAVLRPGIVTAMAGTNREKYVVFGGLAEFAEEELTILADSAGLPAGHGRARGLGWGRVLRCFSLAWPAGAAAYRLVTCPSQYSNQL